MDKRKIMDRLAKKLTDQDLYNPSARYDTIEALLEPGEYYVVEQRRKGTGAYLGEQYIGGKGKHDSCVGRTVLYSEKEETDDVPPDLGD